MITEVDSLVDSKIASIVLPVPRSRRGLDATVLRTCRRVYHEALPILYGENWFSFDNVAAIKTFSVRGLEYDECESIIVRADMASYRFTDRSRPLSLA